MPELPDIVAYIEALQPRVQGEKLERLKLLTPIILKSVGLSPREIEGKRVVSILRSGKRIVLSLEDDLFVVIHLMISGRLLWSDDPAAKAPPKISHCTLHFSSGTLILTEAATKKRASLYLVRGEANLAMHRRDGLEVLECSYEEFREALLKENRTLKRALTNPNAFSGIGNAYSDEILHSARLSPLRLTRSLSEEETQRLFEATQSTLLAWIERLRQQFAHKFPARGQITAFRPEFAVHGKYGQPCPECGMPVQRIRYAENETDYCAKCQNEGRLLADRALSRLLKDDWPKTIEDMVGG